ncbi:hypothetical protein AB0B65_15275 [Micromonospora parva]
MPRSFPYGSWRRMLACCDVSLTLTWAVPWLSLLSQLRPAVVREAIVVPVWA